MKRIICILLTSALLLSSCLITAFSSEKDDEYEIEKVNLALYTDENFDYYINNPLPVKKYLEQPSFLTHDSFYFECKDKIEKAYYEFAPSDFELNNFEIYSVLSDGSVLFYADEGGSAVITSDVLSALFNDKYLFRDATHSIHIFIDNDPELLAYAYSDGLLQEELTEEISQILKLPEVIDPCYIGDVNNDDKVDVTDATLIQLKTAGLYELDKLGEFKADACPDGKIDITDATYVQMYAADKLGSLG